MSDRTVVDAVKQVMRCDECGDEIPFPMGSVTWVVAVGRAFMKVHKNCDGRGGKTWMGSNPEEQE